MFCLVTLDNKLSYRRETARQLRMCLLNNADVVQLGYRPSLVV